MNVLHLHVGMMFSVEPNFGPIRLISPTPIAACDTAKVEMDSMIVYDVVESVKQTTIWYSGLTILPNTNGVDLVALNKCVMRDINVVRYINPLLRVSDIQYNVFEDVLFSTFNFNADPGSLQVEISRLSALECVFSVIEMIITCLTYVMCRMVIREEFFSYFEIVPCYVNKDYWCDADKGAYNSLNVLAERAVETIKRKWNELYKVAKLSRLKYGHTVNNFADVIAGDARDTIPHVEPLGVEA